MNKNNCCYCDKEISSMSQFCNQCFELYIALQKDHEAECKANEAWIIENGKYYGNE